MNPKSGGPSQGIRQMSVLDSDFGVVREVVCFDDPDSPWVNDKNIVIHALGSGMFSYAYQPKLIDWLRTNLIRFDAVVINGLWQYHAYGAWKVLRKTGTPYFVYTHGMLDPWFKHAYPLKHLKKWLYWPWADYRVLRDSTAVLFTCEEEMRLAPESFWLYKANSRVVKYGAARPPNDVDRLRLNFLDKFPNLQDKRLLLFLSRIHEKKGCDLIIEAFANLSSVSPDLMLVMAGPDQTGITADLVQLAKRLGVEDRIIWTGMLQGDLKWGAFYASELFVLPSHQENFGISVAEALGCGLPVLISNKVNIWREIQTDGSGFVGNDDLADTERSLANWLSLSAEERSSMKQKARCSFEDRYTVDQMASSLLSTIGEFL